MVHLAERLPWHDALYFVTSTLTTVGYGDIVMKSALGRLIVLTMMVAGVILIPVQASQLYSQLQALRVTVGPTPQQARFPFLLMSTRLQEVRAFADLFQELFHQVELQQQLPQDTRLVVLGDKPSYEFTSFQELHDRQLTLVEGSVLAESDLVRCRLQAAEAVLVLGDRFTVDAAAEDLDVLFRVWAIKSYTKAVPLAVQVLRASAIAQVQPFLDPHQDSVFAIEQTRHRLLAVSCLCPGASTLIGNLLHAASVEPDLAASATRPLGSDPPLLAGRRWLAEYARGANYDLYVVPASARLPRNSRPASSGGSKGSSSSSSGSNGNGNGNGSNGNGKSSGVLGSVDQVLRSMDQVLGSKDEGASGGAGVSAGRVGLAGLTFSEAADVAFSNLHVLLLGVMSDSGCSPVALNPSRRVLQPSDQLVVAATHRSHAEALSWFGLPDGALLELSMAAGEGGARPPAGSKSGPFDANRSCPAEWADPPRVAPPPAPARALTTVLSAVGPAAEQARLHNVMAAAGVVGPTAAASGPSTTAVAAAAADSAASAATAGAVAATHLPLSPSADNSSAAPANAAISPASPAAATGQPSPLSSMNDSDADFDLSKSVQDQPLTSRSVSSSVMGSLDMSADISRFADQGNATSGSRAAIKDGVGPIIMEGNARSAAGSNGSSSSSSGSSGNGNGSSGSGYGNGSRSSSNGSSKGSKRGVPFPVNRSGGSYDPDRYEQQRKERNGSNGGNGSSNGSNGSSNGSNGSNSSNGGWSGMGLSDLVSWGGNGGSAAVNSWAGNSYDGGLMGAMPPSAGAGSAKGQGGAGGNGQQQQLLQGGMERARAGVGAPAGPHQPQAPWRRDALHELRGHVILCGAHEAFLEFAALLHKAAGAADGPMPLVVIHAALPDSVLLGLAALGPVHLVRGSPTDRAALAEANAKTARCLVFLATHERLQHSGHHADEHGSTTRSGVLCDAEALLACYGVGEDDCSDDGPAHTVVELAYTSSIRFLQPGLMLNGQHGPPWVTGRPEGPPQPRSSWLGRRRAEEAAARQGLVAWQANSYYCAGHVVVPALMDTFTCQAFFNRRVLPGLMSELCGDDDRPGGTMLRQIPVPGEFVGRPYLQLFRHLTRERGMLPLGLYRQKGENSAWRMGYVATNPAWADVVHASDMVFVLRNREAHDDVARRGGGSADGWGRISGSAAVTQAG